MSLAPEKVILEQGRLREFENIFNIRILIGFTFTVSQWSSSVLYGKVQTHRTTGKVYSNALTSS